MTERTSNRRKWMYLMLAFIAMMVAGYLMALLMRAPAMTDCREAGGTWHQMRGVCLQADE